MIFIGLMPVGSLLAGALAHSLGGSITVGLFALSVLFGAFVYVRFAQRQGVDTDVASPTAGTSKVSSGERLTCRKDV